MAEIPVEAVSAEVSGEPEEVSLLDAVAAGRVPCLAEMPFSDWLKWRAGSGKRPTGAPRCSRKQSFGRL